MKKLILALVIGMFAVPALANLYVVPDIRVSVEAENAVQAKERALSEAAVQAFETLFNRLVFDEALSVFVQVPTSVTDETETAVQSDPVLPTDGSVVVITPEKIATLVEGVSVSGEKNTKTRYMATVTVQFKEKAVQDFLTEKNVAFLDKEPPQMVVVPVFRENGYVQVFDESNPLFQSLKKSAPSTGLHQLIVPQGDVTDHTLGMSVATGSNENALETLAHRYQSGASVVMDVTKNGSVYTVKTWVYPASVSAGSEVSFAVSSSATNVSGVLAQIVKRTLGNMDRKFKAYQAYRTSARSGVTAVFEVVSLAEWTALENQLKKFEFIEQTNVRAVYKNQIYTELVFSENTHSALNKMKMAGMSLMPEGNIYVWQKNTIY